jgi:hypothetical protein
MQLSILYDYPWSGSWTRDGTVSIQYLDKGPIRLLGGDEHTLDAGQPHMLILGLEAGLERVPLASNISTKGPSDWWAGAHTPRMQPALYAYPWSGSWIRDGAAGLQYIDKGSIRLVGRSAHTVDAA